MSASILKRLAHRAGALAVVDAAWRDRLTVLAYHRVAAPDGLYAPVISATPQGFARQMDYLRRHFSPVSLGEVAAWLRGAGTLPPRPVLVTFDDGYRDNLTAALPILRARGIPATVYVATGHVEAQRPFFWDIAAWCYANTRRPPDQTLGAWLAAAKRLSPLHRDAALAALADRLEVTPPALSGLVMDWDEARRMAAAGIDIGAHTAHHAILSSLTLDEAAAEVAASKAAVEREVGAPCLGFAYPNGQAEDFAPEHETLLADQGFACAVSLVPGPSGYAEARARPFAIRRCTINLSDDPTLFAAKLHGATRLATWFKRRRRAAPAGLYGAPA